MEQIETPRAGPALSRSRRFRRTERPGSLRATQSPRPGPVGYRGAAAPRGSGEGVARSREFFESGTRSANSRGSEGREPPRPLSRILGPVSSLVHWRPTGTSSLTAYNIIDQISAGNGTHDYDRGRVTESRLSAKSPRSRAHFLCGGTVWRAPHSSVPASRSVRLDGSEAPSRSARRDTRVLGARSVPVASQRYRPRAPRAALGRRPRAPCAALPIRGYP